jgi:hypothetical protein
MMKVVLKIEIAQLFWNTFFRKWVRYSGTEGVRFLKKIFHGHSYIPLTPWEIKK